MVVGDRSVAAWLGPELTFLYLCIHPSQRPSFLFCATLCQVFDNNDAVSGAVFEFRESAAAT